MLKIVISKKTIEGIFISIPFFPCERKELTISKIIELKKKGFNFQAKKIIKKEVKNEKI